MTFKKDLEIGSEFEQRLCKFIQRRYPTATRIGSAFADYDIFIAETGMKVECKYDKKAKDTGNVFIELKSNDNSSGILSSFVSQTPNYRAFGELPPAISYSFASL